MVARARHIREAAGVNQRNEEVNIAIKFVQKFNVTKIVLVDKIIEKRPVIVLASGDGLRGSYGQCSGRKMPPLPCGHSKLKSVPQRLRAKFRKQFGEQRLRIRISVTRQKE